MDKKEVEAYNKQVEEENKAWKEFLVAEKAKIGHDKEIARLNLSATQDTSDILKGLSAIHDRLSKKHQESLTLIEEQDKRLDRLMTFYPNEEKKNAKKNSSKSK